MFKKISLGLLSLILASASFAGTLTTDLYRGGNSTSPLMDKVRTVDTTTSGTIDVDVYDKNGVKWVKANGKGISTFNTALATKNWWKAPKGTTYPSSLRVYNDNGNHWTWAPAFDMPLSDYIKLMQQTNSSFTKLPTQ